MRRARMTAMRAAAVACALCAIGVAEASAAYQDTVLGTPGLVSYWRLGEASGTTAVDAKGLQNGTLGGVLEYGQAGALNNNSNTAINFNAQADTFSAPDRAEYDLNGFTIEFWVRLNSYGDTTTWRRLASKGAGRAERNWLIGLVDETQGQVIYSYGDTAGGMQQNTSVASLALNTWYHVVVTHVPGTKLQLFLNGALDSEKTATTTPVTSTSPVGLASANGEWTNGRFDEHAIYNRALTAAEVLQHYRAGIDGTPPETTITANPANPTTSTSASFSFTSSEANSTFECKLDAGSYGSCTSPKAYSGLAVGTHTFSVRATDQAGNPDPTPATYTWTIQSTSSCTPGFGSYGGTVFPPACWKPYGSLAPWNQQLPASPTLASNSSAIVARIIGDISAVNYPDNMVIRDNGLSGEPTYWSRSTDPLYTIHCTEPWGTCEVEGMQIRIPAGAKPEAPSDEHMTVVDQASGYEYSFWNVQTQPLPPGGGTININWGGRQPVTSGDGNSSAATAASFGGLAGRLRAEELAATDINHALNIVIDCSSNTVVFPVVEGHGGRACSTIGKSNVDAPPMGTRLQLNMTDAEIAALKQTDGSDVPAWREKIYRAMAKYGMFFGDTGVGGYFSVEYEAGIQYTSVGAADKWKQFAIDNAWPRTSDNTGYVGFFRFDNVDWANRLRVIAPCVSQRTC